MCNVGFKPALFPSDSVFCIHVGSWDSSVVRAVEKSQVRIPAGAAG